MTYDELIKKLQHGKKMRKKNWLKGDYIYFNLNDYNCYTEDGSPAKIEYLIKGSAEDWEELVDIVPIKKLVGKKIQYHGSEYYVSPPVTQLKKVGDQTIVYCLTPVCITHAVVTITLPEDFLVPENWIVK